MENIAILKCVSPLTTIKIHTIVMYEYSDWFCPNNLINDVLVHS